MLDPLSHQYSCNMWKKNLVHEVKKIIQWCQPFYWRNKKWAWEAVKLNLLSELNCAFYTNGVNGPRQFLTGTILPLKKALLFIVFPQRVISALRASTVFSFLVCKQQGKKRLHLWFLINAQIVPLCIFNLILIMMSSEHF